MVGGGVESWGSLSASEREVEREQHQKGNRQRERDLRVKRASRERG